MANESNGSNLQDKTAYELERQRLRFNPLVMQSTGPSKTGPSYWVPAAKGTFAYPVGDTYPNGEDSEVNNG